MVDKSKTGAIRIESQSGCHAQFVCHQLHVPLRADAVDRTLLAAGDIEESLAIKGHSGGIHHLAEEWFDVSLGIDAEDRDRHFLAAASAKSDEEVTLAVESRTGDGM